MADTPGPTRTPWPRDAARTPVSRVAPPEPNGDADGVDLWQRRGRHAALALAVLVVAAVFVLSAMTPGSSAAFSVKVTNSVDTAGVAVGNSCAWTYATGSPTPYVLYPLSDNPVTATAADTSGNKRTGAYVGTPAHSTSNACARDKDGSTTFNGTSTALAAPDQQSSPQTLSLEIWFKTTVAGGYLIGLNSAKTGLGGSYDRHLYLNSTGQVVFGIYSGGTRTVTSTASYNDGAWHHAVGTFSSTAGLTLYLDGKSVGTPITTAYTAENNTGYWRIGYANLSGWPGSATPYYFSGQLGYAAVYLSVLSSSTVTSHYSAGV